MSSCLARRKHRAGSALLASLLCVLVATVLSGCSKETAAPGQVVARVNADDISVHQLNFALAQMPRKTISNGERETLVEKMIDRQLLQQQARSKKLDRRPEVMARLEESRLDILAAAYAEELSDRSQAPGEDAAAAYFSEHPALFAQRRIYRLREISIPENSKPDAPGIAQVEARLARKENLTELIAWLRQQPGVFFDQLAIRPAEELPLEAADRLLGLKRGDTLALRLPGALVIYEVQSFEAAPLNWNTAAPSIRTFLKNRQTSAAVKEELLRLRSAAKISKNPLTDK